MMRFDVQPAGRWRGRASISFGHMVFGLMSRRHVVAIAAILCAAALLATSGCGRRGPLQLPESAPFGEALPDRLAGDIL